MLPTVFPVLYSHPHDDFSCRTVSLEWLTEANAHLCARPDLVPRLSSGGFAEFSRCFPGLCEGKSALVPTCISQPCLPVANVGPTRILPNLYLGCQRDVLNKVGALKMSFIAGFIVSSRNNSDHLSAVISNTPGSQEGPALSSG